MTWEDPDVEATLASIEELGHIEVRDGRILRATPPRNNLCASRWDRWSPTLRYLSEYARNHEDFGGQFFVCLYDGWREYSEPAPPSSRRYVPWLSPDFAPDRPRYLGHGVQNEPRFRHPAPDSAAAASATATLYPELCLPVLAYNRHVEDRNTLLLPDAEFLENQFAGFVRQVWAHDVPFAEKVPRAVWRGSRNNGAKYLGTAAAHGVPHPVHPRDLAVAYSVANPSCLDASYDHAPIPWMLRHRYLLDLDGMVSAWSALYWKLCSNSVVIKLASHWEQWYYDRLAPYRHYVPIETLYDLERAVLWCENNPAAAQQVAADATSLARSLTYEYATTTYRIR